MAQSYKTIHDFQFLNLAQSSLNVAPLGTNIILDNTQSGDILLLNATAGSIVNLPSPSSGLSYAFIVRATGGHTISAPTASIYGAIGCSNANPNPGTVGSTLTTGPAKTVIATTSGSSIGDAFTLTSDGTNYYVRGAVANYNALKFM